MPLKAATGPSVVPYQYPNQPLPRPPPTTEGKFLDEIHQQYLFYTICRMGGKDEDANDKSGLNCCLGENFKEEGKPPLPLGLSDIKLQNGLPNSLKYNLNYQINFP